jgi:predicted double-glycine peptidase
MKTNLKAKIACAVRSKTAMIRWRKGHGAALLLIAMTVLGLGCASYRGTATPAQPSAVAQQGQWTMVPNFPHVAQLGEKDCGAASLAAVLRYWGHSASPESIATALDRTDSRLQAGEMESYARDAGLRSYVFFGTMKDVIHELDRGRPVIVGLGKMVEEKKALSHYEVVVGYEPHKKQVLLLDPARGWQVDTYEGFAKEWAISKAVTMVVFPEPAAAARTAGEGTAVDPSTDAQRYAAREATSPEAKKYRAGDYIVISASALIVILLIVIIVILV